MIIHDKKIVIEFTDYAVRALAVRRGECVLLREVPRTADTAVDVGSLGLARVAQGGEVLVIVSRRETVLKRLLLPSIDEAEIRRMVACQAPVIDVFGSDSVVFGYQTCQRFAEGNADVVVALSGEEAMEQYLDALRRHALVPSGIFVSGISAVAACPPAAPEVFRIIVNIDRRHSEICFCRGVQVLFSKHLIGGREQVRDGDASLWAEEAVRTLRLFLHGHKEYIPSECSVIADSETFSRVEPALSSVINGPIRREEVEGAFHPGPKAVREEFIKMAQTSSVAALVGALGLRAGDTMNLLPAAEIAGHRHVGFQRDLRRLLIAAGGAVLMLIVFLSARVAVYQRRIEDAERRMSAMAPRVKALERDQQVMAFFASQYLKPSVSEVIAGLVSLTPADVTCQLVRINADREVVIQADTPVPNQVRGFQEGLLRHPAFRDVQLRYANRRKRLNRELSEFRMTLRAVRNGEGL